MTRITDELINRLANQFQGEDAKLVRAGLVALRVQRERMKMIERQDIAATAMQDHTPYHARLTSELERERRCKEFIFEHVPQVEHIFEAFGGVGIVGQLLAEVCPKAQIWATDLDSVCVARYNKAMNGRGHAIAADATEFITQWDKPNWAATLDFNKFTLRDVVARMCWRTALIDEVVSHQPVWLHVGDSACKYLHLNWKCYGISDHHILTYLNKLDDLVSALWGYWIWRVGKHNGAAQMLLLPKQPRSEWQTRLDGNLEFYWKS